MVHPDGGTTTVDFSDSLQYPYAAVGSDGTAAFTRTTTTPTGTSITVTLIHPNGDIVASAPIDGGGQVTGISVNSDGTAVVTVTGRSNHIPEDVSTVVIVQPDGGTTNITMPVHAFFPAQLDTAGTSAYLTTVSGSGTADDPFVTRITRIAVAPTPSSTL